MTIDREIILDLMPLYRSGLASQPSRKLVEAWLGEHPAERFEDLGGSADPEGTEVLAAFARARRLRRLQRRLYAIAVGLTVLCFSVQLHFEGGRLAWARLLAFDHPLAFAPLIAAAAASWAGYAWLRRRLR